MTLTPQEQAYLATPRRILPEGYRAFNGAILTGEGLRSYNRIQERINTFIEARLPVPEYLEAGSMNIFTTIIDL